MTSAIWIPCRLCGAERGDLDAGSGLCVACRRLHGEATSGEVRAALAKLERSEGGTSLPVRWQTARAPQHLWFRCPPSKDEPIRVLVVPLDERPA